MTELVVGWHEGHWTVARKGGHSVNCTSRQNAMLAAVRWARRLARIGRPLQDILVRSRHGDFETVWPADRDPRGSWIAEEQADRAR